jgi:DNA-nicking Smr family endonuclease
MTNDPWLEYIKFVKKIKHNTLAKAAAKPIKLDQFSTEIKAELFNLQIPASPPPLQKKRLAIAPIDAKIDLHGLTQAEAYIKLKNFLEQSYAQNKKHALIVTGKGPIDTPGVIKLAVPRWLQYTEVSKYVLSYTTAKPNFGGEGAISVILRSKKA